MVKVNFYKARSGTECQTGSPIKVKIIMTTIGTVKIKRQTLVLSPAICRFCFCISSLKLE